MDKETQCSQELGLGATWPGEYDLLPNFYFSQAVKLYVIEDVSLGMVLLHSTGWPGTRYRDEVGLHCTDPPALG